MPTETQPEPKFFHECLSALKAGYAIRRRSWTEQPNKRIRATAAGILIFSTHDADTTRFQPKLIHLEANDWEVIPDSRKDDKGGSK